MSLDIDSLAPIDRSIDINGALPPCAGGKLPSLWRSSNASPYMRATERITATGFTAPRTTALTFCTSSHASIAFSAFCPRPPMPIR